MVDVKSVDRLKSALQCLPGVGPKSAQRMAFHLLERDREGAQNIGSAIYDALQQVTHCSRCHNFSESLLCMICDSPSRESQRICVVETPADLDAIEQAGFYKGMYFVLMGHLSPLDRIGPEKLGVNKLIDLLEKEAVEEVVLATNLTMEGQATADFLLDLLQDKVSIVSRLARGMPMGSELEYLDAATLNQAYSDRKIV